MREVGDGLTALHERGLLHRDVKPANVLFRTVDPRAGSDESEPRVRAMLADLGLGKELDVSSRLTMIAGTPSYVAPEQARGEHLDPRADQYSLAALTHLLLAGAPPYRHASLAAAAEPGPPPTLSTPDRRSPRPSRPSYGGGSRPTATTAGPTSRRTSRRSSGPSATRRRLRRRASGWPPTRT